MIYFPQLEQEQSEPQLPSDSLLADAPASCGKGGVQLEEPEHPHSPFILTDFAGVGGNELCGLGICL